MKKKYQVFISSTYSDLIKERQSAVEAILRAGHMPAGMELFSAGNESQLDIIKRWIEDSDIYMLLLGGRYGSIEPKSKLSYTEIEYRYALELEKPIFSLIINETALNKKVKNEGKEVLELHFPEKLKEFKTLVMSKICREFNDATEIKLGAMESLLDIQSRYNLSGWIRSNEAPDVSGLLKEMDELREKNKELIDNRKSTATTKNPNENMTFGIYSFNELKKILLNEKIDVPTSLSNSGKPEKTTLLNLFISNSSLLALGLFNNQNSTKDDIRYFLKTAIPPLLSFELIEKLKPNTGSSFEKFQTSKTGYRFLAALTAEKHTKR